MSSSLTFSARLLARLLMDMYHKEIVVSDSLAAGGRYKYFIDKDHPLAMSGGMVYLHRHIASLKVGRWLTADEHVHHIDGDACNNEPSNLEILSSSEHGKRHRPILNDCICKQCGIRFSPDRATQVFCSPNCSSASLIKNAELTKEVLDALIPTTSWVELGEIFNYSDVGIKKRAIALGCIIPKRRGK